MPLLRTPPRWRLAWSLPEAEAEAPGEGHGNARLGFGPGCAVGAGVLARRAAGEAEAEAAVAIFGLLRLSRAPGGDETGSDVAGEKLGRCARCFMYYDGCWFTVSEKCRGVGQSGVGAPAADGG